MKDELERAKNLAAQVHNAAAALNLAIAKAKESDIECSVSIRYEDVEDWACEVSVKTSLRLDPSKRPMN